MKYVSQKLDHPLVHVLIGCFRDTNWFCIITLHDRH